MGGLEELAQLGGVEASDGLDALDVRLERLLGCLIE